MWIALGHPEAKAIMRDQRCLLQDHLDKLINHFSDERIFLRQKLDIPYIDGASHHPTREHMIATFRDIDMAALGRFCTRMFNEHLDRIRTGDWCDLMLVLANPLPVLAARQLMGVPRDLQTEVLQQVGHFVARADSSRRKTPPARTMRR